LLVVTLTINIAILCFTTL